MLFGLPKIVRPIWEIGLSLDLGIPMDSPHCLYRVSWLPGLISEGCLLIFRGGRLFPELSAALPP